MPPRQKQPSRRAMGSQTSQQPTAKQRRSALRSAAQQQQVLRDLRRPLLVVRFVVRLRRARTATLALRGSPSATSPGNSPGKRRHSAEPLDGKEAPEEEDASSPPQSKRAAPSAPLLGR